MLQRCRCSARRGSTRNDPLLPGQAPAGCPRPPLHAAAQHRRGAAAAGCKQPTPRPHLCFPYVPQNKLPGDGLPHCGRVQLSALPAARSAAWVAAAAPCVGLRQRLQVLERPGAVHRRCVVSSILVRRCEAGRGAGEQARKGSAGEGAAVDGRLERASAAAPATAAAWSQLDQERKSTPDPGYGAAGQGVLPPFFGAAFEQATRQATLWGARRQAAGALPAGQHCRQESGPGSLPELKRMRQHRGANPAHTRRLHSRRHPPYTCSCLSRCQLYSRWGSSRQPMSRQATLPPSLRQQVRSGQGREGLRQAQVAAVCGPVRPRPRLPISDPAAGKTGNHLSVLVLSDACVWPSLRYSHADSWQPAA